MSRGFTLIEALVAMAVLSVGLLGAAGMLVGGLRDQTLALRHGAAALLVEDMASRIRANPSARAAYDSSSATDAASACDQSVACDARALAANDLAHFESAALALLPGLEPHTHVFFEPAIGSATADRYAISLQWRAPSDPETTDESTLILLAQPVAGMP